MKTSTLNLSTDALDHLARRRAGARLGWQIHALVYVAVNAGLAFLAWSNGQTPRMGTLLGWGLGLAIHGGVVAFGLRQPDWFERRVARERAQLVAHNEPRA